MQKKVVHVVMEDGAGGEGEEEEETVAESEAEDLCKIDEEFLEEKPEVKVEYDDHCHLCLYIEYNRSSWKISLRTR